MYLPTEPVAFGETLVTSLSWDLCHHGKEQSLTPTMATFSMWFLEPVGCLLAYSCVISNRFLTEIQADRVLSAATDL